MRYLFTIHEGVSFPNGPNANALRLLPELRNRGNEIRVLAFCRRGVAPVTERLRAAGFDCALATIEEKGTQAHVRWVLENVRCQAPDVFIPNLSIFGLFAGRWIRAAHIPTIAVQRNDDPFYRAVVDAFVTGPRNLAVSGLVSVSEDLQRRVAERRPRHTRLCTIPSGVPIPRRTANVGGPLRLVYVGRLVQQQKCVLDVVGAFCTIARALPDARCSVIGAGSEEARLRRRVHDAGLDGRIVFHGAVDPTCIQQRLLDHNVIVLLSDYEGTPGALMDGMACGLVPVCLDIAGGVRELVTDGVTGLLVDDREQSFLNAIRRLYSSLDLRAQLARAARSHVADAYSLASAADRWESFCKELVCSVSSRRPVRVPRCLRLLPVRTEFAHEDHRAETTEAGFLRGLYWASAAKWRSAIRRLSTS